MLSFKKTLLALVLSLPGLNLYAQDETDALRFSFLSPQGTARSIGFGSALGSIGGDFTSLSVNPAGIGVYRRSEAMFTPSLMFNGVESRYSTGNRISDDGARLAFSNAGFVLTKAEKGKGYNKSDWKAVSFGFGINRLADFSRNYTYSGENHENSASYVFEYDANNGGDVSAEGTPAYLGYESYLLIDSIINGSLTSVSVVDPVHYGVRQTNEVRERGGISEMVLSLGGNYREKILLGATLGIPLVRYTRSKTFTEQDLSSNNNNYFSDFTYTEDLKTTGAGVNLKLGAILTPNDYFRLGAAIHTPTYLGLTDMSAASITANTENFAGIQAIDAPENQHDYALITPWRAVISASGLMGKYGFVTVDYEYVDYSSARYRLSALDRQYERAINQTIRDKYTAAGNIRLGLELRFEGVGIRGGFGYYGNPYKSRLYDDGQRMDFSAGLGYRFKGGTFIDFAFTHRWYQNPEQPYMLSYTNVGEVPTADLETKQDNAVLTLGWKF